MCEDGGQWSYAPPWGSRLVLQGCWFMADAEGLGPRVPSLPSSFWGKDWRLEEI